MLLMNAAYLFSQPTDKNGYTFILSYHNFFMYRQHISTGSFDISDYKDFGMGKEHLEGRMRLINKPTNYMQVFNFSAYTYFVERNRLIYKLSLSIFDFSIGYNLFENQHFYFTIHTGYNYVFYWNRLGELRYLDNYQYPIYKYLDKQKVYANSHFNIFYFEIRNNIKLKNANNSRTTVFFYGIRPAYVFHNKRISKPDYITLLQTDTYNEIDNVTKMKYFNIMYSIGFYFVKFK